MLLCTSGVAEHDYVIDLEPLPVAVDADANAGAKGGKKPAAKPKKGGGGRPGTIDVEEENAGPHPYVESGTKIALTVRFAKPLVYLPEHRPRPDFKPNDIIPRRIKPLK